MNDDNEIGFLKSGKYRIPILKLLHKSKYIPSEIAKKMNITISQVSRTLSELEKYGLVICENPDMKKGRVYAITEKGILTLNKLGEDYK